MTVKKHHKASTLFWGTFLPPAIIFNVLALIILIVGEVGGITEQGDFFDILVHYEKSLMIFVIGNGLAVIVGVKATDVSPNKKGKAMQEKEIGNQPEYQFYKKIETGDFAGHYILDVYRLSTKNNFAIHANKERQKILDDGGLIVEVNE